MSAGRNRSRWKWIPWWGPVSRVACKSQLGPTLHVRTCRMTVLDLKNGWTDCAQIWYTDRDQLLGCQFSWKHFTQFLRTGLKPSFARLSPQKAPYWLVLCCLTSLVCSQQPFTILCLICLILTCSSGASLMIMTFIYLFIYLFLLRYLLYLHFFLVMFFVLPSFSFKAFWQVTWAPLLQNNTFHFDLPSPYLGLTKKSV